MGLLFKRILNFCIFGLTLILTLSLDAAEKSEPSGNPIENVKIRIVGDNGGLLTIYQKDLPNPPPRFLLFLRLNENSFEILGRGYIAGSQDNKYLIEIVRESIIKRPMEGDYVIPMAPPKDFPKLEELLVVGSNTVSQEPDLSEDKGYAQLDWGNLKNSSYLSTGFAQTNEYKDIYNYNPDSMHFLWYFDFLWHFGLEWSRINGKFLTNSYDKRQFYSEMNESKFSLHYRFRKFYRDQMRLAIKINSFTNDFLTENKDDYLLSSRTAGSGAGLRLSWERKEPQWQTEAGNPFTIQQIVLEHDYYPSLEIVDLDYSRGENSHGSTLTQQQVTISILTYLKWMPLFQRFVVDVSAGRSTSEIQFHGQTSAPTGLPNTILSEGHYSENYDYIKVSFGLRMDDMIGRFFKPR